MKNILNKYSYCCGSGNITLKEDGEIVTANHSKGYLCVGSHLAHRVAWLFFYGEWPNGQIDHINHNKKDNRILNLRCVSNMDNHRNMPIQKNNTSGIVGVHFIEHKLRWVSYIKVNAKRIHLGTFDNLFDACCVRRSKEFKLGFHINHGKHV